MRLKGDSLVEMLECVKCRGEVRVSDDALVCKNCGEHFSFFRGLPVMLAADNTLFPPSAYRETRPLGGAASRKGGLGRRLKRLVPKKSVNVARERMFGRVSKEHHGHGKKILVIGCGNQTQQLERHFGGDGTIFVFCDIDKSADADVFCDSHVLPFRPGSFDGIISTAVMEHVLYPDKVVAEIERVLKDDGFVYSEIPFLQGVHEGAYDFSRFSLSGHRRLYEGFSEIETGMVAGPGTVLCWGIEAFGRSLANNRKISAALGLLARSLFFWLKYVDFVLKDNPVALDNASCTYFYGHKADQRIDPAQIIARYEGRKYSHT